MGRLDPRIIMGYNPQPIEPQSNALMRGAALQGVQQRNALEAMQAQDMHEQRAIRNEQMRRAAAQEAAKRNALMNLPMPNAGVNAMPGGPTQAKAGMLQPVDPRVAEIRRLVQAGVLPIEKYMEAMDPNFGRAKVARTVEVAGPNGRPMTVLQSDYGDQIGAGMPKAVEAKTMNLGGHDLAYDPYLVQPGQRFQRSQTPDSIASNSVARDRLSFDKTQAAGAVTYQQDAEGNFVALPTRAAPGQVIKGNAVVAPGPGMLPLQGKGAGMTEDQGKATGWLVQAQNAFGNMRSAIDPNTGNPSAAKPGLNDALAAIPSMGLTTAVANTMRGTNRQKFMQASSSLSEALLRAATGAGVNKDEAAQKVRELTPVFGDDDDTIKQKMDSIPLYIESLKVRAGPGAKKAAGIGGGTPAGAFDASDPLGLRR